jgi:hypothetical protein
MPLPRRRPAMHRGSGAASLTTFRTTGALLAASVPQVASPACILGLPPCGPSSPFRRSRQHACLTLQTGVLDVLTGAMYDPRMPADGAAGTWPQGPLLFAAVR